MLVAVMAVMALYYSVCILHDVIRGSHLELFYPAQDREFN